MRLICLANARLPTEKAHGLEIMKLCEAFSRFFETKLVAPRRINKIKVDPFDHYRVAKSFKIIKLPVLDAIAMPFLGRLGFWIEAFSFSIAAFFYALFKTDRHDIIFSHENAALFVVSFVRQNVIYDIHDFPVAGLIFYRWFFKRCFGITTTNQWKKEELIKRFNIKPEKILVHPNGVEIREFNIQISKEEARKKLNIPLDKKVVVYTGHLFSWKGADTLALASQYLRNDYLIYFVGGTQIDIKNFADKYGNFSNIRFAGHRPHSEMPFWLKAADILVLPNTAKEDISKYFTSPMKLLEYMASKTPIVASDLPSIRYIVDERFVNFFKPDDSRDLAMIISSVVANPEEALRKAEASYIEVQKYSWEERAKKIWQYVSRLIDVFGKNDRLTLG